MLSDKKNIPHARQISYESDLTVPVTCEVHTAMIRVTEQSNYNLFKIYSPPQKELKHIIYYNYKYYINNHRAKCQYKKGCKFV